MIRCPNQACSQIQKVSCLESHLQSCAQKCETCGLDKVKDHDCIRALKLELQTQTWFGIIDAYLPKEVSSVFQKLCIDKDLPLPIMRGA